MIISAARSACGLTHQRNDDRIIVDTTVLRGAEQPLSQAAMAFVSDGLPYLAAVFDGVGGSVRGDLAAQAAVDSLLASSNISSLRARLDLCTHDTAAFQKGLAEKDRAFTVGAGIYLTEDDITLFHMGDCRVYRLQNGELHLLTRDHSLAQRYRDEMGPDCEVPPQIAHVVTTFIGGDLPDPWELSSDFILQPNDLFLCCSDGFWEHAALAETQDILAKVIEELQEADLTSDSLQDALTKACESLIVLAQNEGSPDDISIILTWNAPVSYIEDNN